MKVVAQRVKMANVSVNNRVVGQIDCGLLLLVGLSKHDSLEQLTWMARKSVNLRIFERDGLMQDSVLDMGGEILAVSQFTLVADCRKGKRPSFTDAMPPAQAEPMFDDFVLLLEKNLGKPVKTGEFGANMQVTLVNDGPVTIILER
ncbi:MAG: D-tyrosyl-tRNA(Tyr) deacylase [Cyanothece sp. SIO2G6]|nr:D-tyrosyl-tRNA(Tyr) deacylase [Cyanothece sp. SIO2G6]